MAKSTPLPPSGWASEPSAVYDWYYFQDRPVAFVTATFLQTQPATWHELHPLELNYPGDAFLQDERAQSAVLHALMVIGEIAAHLEDEVLKVFGV